MGYIGLDNRGDQAHHAFLEHGDNRTVAVCDLRDDYMDFAIQKSRHPGDTSTIAACSGTGAWTPR